jgi:hypothetical protein
MKISLNNEMSIDLEELLASRAVFLANSGGGKSWLIRRVAEQAINKVQVIILDPEGEFASLREKHDFILAGKDMDVPVEVRSAAMLAIKLLELNKSAVIDLYELHPQDRQRYVKFFCDALVNCPKNLYHPVLIILDEAHEYVPEGKPSEASYAVELLAAKGRKRGQCLILASQRISKLSKNAAAECNNKLIGRASQDIDMKRAADELGFTKEKMVELRQLKPGEFFAFGPAISDEVKKVRIGEVKTTHAKVGYKGLGKTPPPSEVIKKVLAGLKDLPAEAQKEASTVLELQKQNRILTQEISTIKRNPKVTNPDDVKKAVQSALFNRDKFWGKEIERWQKEINRCFKAFAEVYNLVERLQNFKFDPNLPTVIDQSAKTFTVNQDNAPAIFGSLVKKIEKKNFEPGTVVQIEGLLSGPEQRVLNAIAWMESIGNNEPELTAIAFLAGYTFGGGGFNNAKGSLRTKGLVEYRADKIVLTDGGRALAQMPEGALTTQDLHKKVLGILPGPEQKLLKPLLEAYPNDLSNEELAEQSGYALGAGGFNNPKGRLRSLGLVEYPGKGRVKAKSLLFLD